MKLIVGLGNPGEKYENTRHNTGFLVLDKLKSQFSIFNFQFSNKSQLPNFKFQKRFNAEICDLVFNGEKIILVKPQTFMNESGRVVKKLATSYQLPATSIYVVHDDLDIPLGEYKIQFGKGPKVHKGILSIEEHLKIKDFWRVRVGIAGEHYRLIKMDKDKSMADDYVLKPFTKEEKEILDKLTGRVIEELLIKIHD